MSSLGGGFQRPGGPSVHSPRAEEADESDDNDDPVARNAQQDTLLDTYAQGDLGGDLATP